MASKVEKLLLEIKSDLSDLKNIKAELNKVKADVGKAGTEAGKDFSKNFTSQVKGAAAEAKSQAEGIGSSFGSLGGVITKVGATIAGAFALDKVIGFFDDAMTKADEFAKEMGTVSKATEQINEDFEALGKKGTWDKLKVSIGTALNEIKTGLKAAAVAMNDFFFGRDPDRIVTVYRRTRDSLAEMGTEIEKLNSIHKRTADEELKLINLKDELSKKAKQLGVDYDGLVASGRNVVQIMQVIQSESRLNAQADLTVQQNRAIQRFNALEAGIQQQRSSLQFYEQRGDTAQVERLRRAILRSESDLERERANVRSIANRSNNLDAQEERPAQNSQAPSTPGKARPEVRFIEAQKRLSEIAENEKFTRDKINADRTLDPNERERRLKLTAEDAKSRADAEIGALRSAWAEFNEDRNQAETEALAQRKREAERASREILEAELINAKILAEKGEITETEKIEKIEKASRDSEDRLQKIREKYAELNAKRYIQSFGETLQGANNIAQAALSFRSARDAGGQVSAIGSAVKGVGDVSAGISKVTGLTDKFGAAGPIGSAIAIGGQLISSFISLFGEDEAERERKRAERDAQALKLLEAQEKHQRDLLEFQKSQAALPFKNLQRELRLIDLQAQRSQITGTSQEAADAERLQKRSSAIKATLQSEAGKFEGGVFFNQAARSPEELSAALGEVDKYQGSFALLNSVISEVSSTRNQDAEKIGFDFYNQRLNTIAGLPLPPQIKQAATDYIASVAAKGFYKDASRSGINSDQDVALANLGYRSSYGAALFGAAKNYENLTGGRGVNASTGLLDSLIGEFSSDATVLESLYGLLEQDQQTTIEIARNTKETAQNTTKLNQLDDRKSGLLDLGNRRVISSGLAIDVDKLKIPSGAASLVLGSSSVPNAISSDTVTQLKNLVELANEANEYLAIIAANTDGRANTSTSDFDNYLVNRLNQIRSRRIS